MKPAIFLDRDDTIVFDSGYMSKPEQIRLVPDARAALHRAAQAGFELYLLTNQSGINRGYYTMEDAEACNARLEQLLNLPPPGFRGICVAPERPDEPSKYRKPSPAYILERIESDSLDKSLCFMVGDRTGDIRCAENAAIRPVLVAARGECFNADAAEYADARAIPRFFSLSEAVDYAISLKNRAAGPME